jgi:hypothetical protein
MCCQGNDRQLLETGIRTDDFSDVVAVLIRQADIHEHKIKRLLPDMLQGYCPTGCRRQYCPIRHQQFLADKQGEFVS